MTREDHSPLVYRSVTVQGYRGVQILMITRGKSK